MRSTNGGARFLALCIILCLCSACSTGPSQQATVTPVATAPALAAGEAILPYSQIHFHDAPLPTQADLRLPVNAWSLEGYDSTATRAVTLTSCCGGQSSSSGTPLTPAPLWFRSFGMPLLNAPIIGNNHVYLLAPDGYLHVLGVHTGAEQWRVPMGGEMTANGLALANGLLYLALAGHYIAALDADTGQLRWRFDTVGVVRAAPMVVGRDLLVASGANSLVCLDALTGEEYWAFHSEDALAQFWPTRTPPAIAHGLVYVALGASNEFNALDLRTGRKVWEAALGERMTGGPMVDQALRLVYVITWSGRIVAYDSRTGKLRWSAHILGGSESSPALSLQLDTLYLGGFDGNLYAFAADSGRLSWHTAMGSAVVASPAVVQSGKRDWVIVATQGGDCVIVDARNGIHLYHWQLGELRAAPIVANNTLYQASLGDHGLFAVRL
ncbi:MAG: PQQ-binding-like beta-propeller repeat protein [Ktedonobacteraceae bacterium]